MAGSGGSIVSQIISAATNSILVSEINPFAPIRKNKKDPIFDPTSLLLHLTYNSKEISNNYKFKYFMFQLEISINHAHDLSKNLLLRDHTHSTFNYLNQSMYLNKKKISSLFIEPVKYYYEINNLKFNFPRAKPILSIRHPLDNYIAARQRKWLRSYCGSNLNIDNYCKSLIKLQNYIKDNENGIIIRYEDFCVDFEKGLYETFEQMKLDYTIPKLIDINNIKVTGKSGRKSFDVCLRDRQLSEVDEELINEINLSSNYNEYCKMNNYNPNYLDYPLM